MIFLLMAATIFLVAFNKNKGGVFKGADVQVHGGKAWSSVTLDKYGAPEQLSLVLNDAVLTNDPIGSGGPGQSTGNNFIIPLHNKASESTSFKFAKLNWNKSGKAAFTQTLILGSYDSSVIYEPMITMDFKNTQSFERAIPQPVRFKTSGYYPTKMKVTKLAGVTEIILAGFELRKAS